MKKLKYIVFMIPILFGFINTVKADTISSYYIQDTENTKETYWRVGESWLYENNGVIFYDTSENYFVIETCLTGSLKMEITSNTYGNTTFLGYFTDGSCNAQGYSGSLYKYIFKVNQFDISVSGTNPQVGFAMLVTNIENYTVYQDFITVYSENYNPMTDAETSETLKDMNDNIVDTNDKLDNLNDNMTNSDTSDATNEAGNFFSGFETDTFGLTSIITAPLDLIGSITSSSCTPLPLTVPFVDKSFNLPCMSSIYEEHFGSFLNIYQTITFGIVAYWVCVRIFALVKDFKNPDHDEIEVLDL